MPERLWTIDDVAGFMVLSPAQADYAMRQPGAPVPIVLPSKGTGARKIKRWVPDEIREWVTTSQRMAA